MFVLCLYSTNAMSLCADKADVNTLNNSGVAGNKSGVTKWLGLYSAALRNTQRRDMNLTAGIHI